MCVSQVYFDWIKQNIDVLDPDVSVGLFNNVVTLLNYLSQANIENKSLDIDSKQLILPEEAHLRGMTTFPAPKMYFGGDNSLAKNQVHNIKAI